MRLHAKSTPPDVHLDSQARRPVVLRLFGLHIPMTPNEARTLADQLPDISDRREETR